MAASDLAIANQALIRLGERPIGSFTEGTMAAQVLNAIYWTVRDSMLASYYWNFARAEFRLARSAAAPLRQFDYAYALPADFLRAERADTPDDKGGYRITYKITGQQLYTDAEAVILTYTRRTLPTEHAAYFDTALILTLATAAALPITEDEARRNSLAEEAEFARRQARLADSQQDTAEGFENFPILDARG